jgi:hypothetical protein
MRGRLKAVIVEKEEAAVTRQWYGKHVAIAKNKHATIENALFSMLCLPRLYSQDQQQQS